MGRVEDYPEIKSQTQTALVMRELIALEDEIAFMRQGYNDAVEQYNTRISSFPDSILAKIGKFLPLDLLDYQAEVIPMPEIEQETWRRKQVADAAEEEVSDDTWTATVLPVPDPDAPITDAVDQRVFLYASLLDEVGEMRAIQFDMIRDSDERDEGLLAAVELAVEKVQSLSLIHI